MTKFETIGCNLQNEAVSIEEAKRKFSYSCNICCCRGLHIECDYCAIAMSHQLTVAAFNDAKKAEEEAKQRKEKDAKERAEKIARFEKRMESLTKELDSASKKAQELSHILDAMEVERDFFAEKARTRKEEFRNDWYNYQEENLDNWDRG